jgi:hypothetical protein
MAACEECQHQDANPQIRRYRDAGKAAENHSQSGQVPDAIRIGAIIDWLMRTEFPAHRRVSLLLGGALAMTVMLVLMRDTHGQTIPGPCKPVQHGRPGSELAWIGIQKSQNIYGSRRRAACSCSRRLHSKPTERPETASPRSGCPYEVQTFRKFMPGPSNPEPKT